MIINVKEMLNLNINYILKYVKQNYKTISFHTHQVGKIYEIRQPTVFGNE